MAVTPQVSSNALILIKKMVFFANSQQIENVVQAKPIIVENIADVIAATLDREVSLFSCISNLQFDMNIFEISVRSNLF